ncbi:cold-shock protein [Frisingicoccus sp.]|uniref:cold-shock protein n=1 Tax=Frisingicoccus sp. TaxID=1918627 RepID=UPI003AB59364
MHTGKVRWFDAEKGYGFIADDNGGDLFVHQSDIQMEGYRMLLTEQKVTFDVAETPKGNKAVNVVVQ